MDSILVIIAILAIVISLVLSFFFYNEKRKSDSRQERYENRLYEIMTMSERDHNLHYRLKDSGGKLLNDGTGLPLHAKDKYDRSSDVHSYKGFSDESDELIPLRRDIKDLQNELRRYRVGKTIDSKTIDTDEIIREILREIKQYLSFQVQPDVGGLSKLILSEIVEQMSLDHFYELKEVHYKTKIEETQKTLKNVLHILRTPLSGMKINLQKLTQLNDHNNKDIQNRYIQIADAIGVIEANMRAIGAYEDYNGDSCRLKENVQRNIGLLLLTADKKVNLNIEGISEEIILKTEMDSVLLCIACIVENAIVFSPDNSEIIITAEIEASNIPFGNDILQIEITNFGSNIPEDIGNKIFEDGFTSRNSGSGIGLSLARTIVSDKLNGEISFKNISDPDGVKFLLRFEVKS